VNAVRAAVSRARRERPPQTASALERVVNLAVNGVVTGQLRSSAGLGASMSGSAALRAMRLAVHADVRWALERTSLAGSPRQLALREVMLRAWYPYISGRHRYAFSRLFEQVWGVGDTDARERAYQSAAAGACCWYPHREFLIASEWPCELRPELLRARPGRPGGQALLWKDRWGVHLQGGHRVPQWVIEQPDALTVARIESERNAEVRRVLIEHYGWQRYIRDCGAEVVDSVPESHAIAAFRGARLLRKELPGEPEPLVYLEMRNAAPGADGADTRHLERIDPYAYDGDAGRLCHAAMASRWRHRDSSGQLALTFARWQDYMPTSGT
jgi:hypothetical protein